MSSPNISDTVLEIMRLDDFSTNKPVVELIKDLGELLTRVPEEYRATATLDVDADEYSVTYSLSWYRKRTKEEWAKLAVPGTDYKFAIVDNDGRVLMAVDQHDRVWFPNAKPVNETAKLVLEAIQRVMEFGRD